MKGSYTNAIKQDGTERYDFWSRFLLLHSPFLFPPKKEGREKENEVAKIMIKI